MLCSLVFVDIIFQVVTANAYIRYKPEPYIYICYIKFTVYLGVFFL